MPCKQVPYPSALESSIIIRHYTNLWLYFTLRYIWPVLFFKFVTGVAAWWLWYCRTCRVLVRMVPRHHRWYSGWWFQMPTVARWLARAATTFVSFVRYEFSNKNGDAKNKLHFSFHLLPPPTLKSTLTHTRWLDSQRLGCWTDVSFIKFWSFYFTSCAYIFFLFCVFVFSIMYWMYILSYQHILGYGQLSVLDESLSVLLAVSWYCCSCTLKFWANKLMMMITWWGAHWHNLANTHPFLLQVAVV